MRTYFEIIKITLKNSVAYRLNTFISVFVNIVSLFIQIYLWKALLKDTTVENISIDSMISYQIMGAIMSLLYLSSIAHEVGGKVMSGSIAMELIKPYNFSFYMFFKTLGEIISGFIIKGLPLILFSVVVWNFRLNMPLINFLLLMLVISLNIVIFWLMHYIIGLLHFVFVSAGWFVNLLRDTVRIFGGAVVPLWFFPKILKNISLYLPFQLLYQFPQSLFINKISSDEIIFNLTMELVWISVLIFIAVYLWFLGIKKLVIQGG